MLTILAIKAPPKVASLSALKFPDTNLCMILLLPTPKQGYMKSS